MLKALCIQCTGEEDVVFPTVRELNEHIKSGHTIMPKIEAGKPSNPPKSPDNPPSGFPVPEKQPINLVYKFLGNCEICNNPVDTIKVELGDKNMMIAYCPTDKKQWLSQEVIPIEKQISKIYIKDKKTGQLTELQK